MNKNPTTRKFTRRDFIKLGAQGALMGVLAKAVPAVAGQINRMSAPAAKPAAAPALAAPAPYYRHLAATDGHILLPGEAEPLYIFGFIDAPLGATPNEYDTLKGNVQFPAPIIGVDELADVYITLSNISFVLRPDLDDAHTIHWHGFPNATAIFDGVPEVSIAVPPGRDFPYYYKPRRPGTFMYHCHFEDVEHVQMGMTGIVFVRPSQNGSSLGGFTKFAYNDLDGHTGYHREISLLLGELWLLPHKNLPSIQESVWPDYRPEYWTINGRVYPDTIKSANDSSLEIDGVVRQPISSLIQVNSGERMLLRIANLGYQQHAMQLAGITMTVVGEDATLLDNPYDVNVLYIGPGEARDVLFSADFDGTALTDTDGTGTFNRYYFKNRNAQRLTNNGASGLGGMMTEVRVYSGSPVATQTSYP